MNVAIPDFLSRSATVLRNEAVAEGLYVMRLEEVEIARAARPAQFVQILTDDPGAPYLRRPFSFLRIDREGGWFEIYYDVIGSGTSRLQSAVPGDSFGILGPLGRAFSPPEGHLLLVAGGVGLVPLAFLAWAHPDRFASMTLLMGANTTTRLPDLDTLLPVDLERHVATDDGSAGHAGFITDLLEPYTTSETTVFTCGPHPMMARVAQISEALSLPCYASLENHMACGFGACVGCVVEYRTANREDERYRRVCLEGPVVDAREIVW